jgi:hypothetical protein
MDNKLIIEQNIGRCPVGAGGSIEGLTIHVDQHTGLVTMAAQIVHEAQHFQDSLGRLHGVTGWASEESAYTTMFRFFGQLSAAQQKGSGVNPDYVRYLANPKQWFRNTCRGPLYSKLYEPSQCP